MDTQTAIMHAMNNVDYDICINFFSWQTAPKISDHPQTLWAQTMCRAQFSQQSAKTDSQSILLAVMGWDSVYLQTYIYFYIRINVRLVSHVKHTNIHD